MLHNRIKPVDESRNNLLIPEQEAAIARIGVEHKAQADVVALALHAVNAAPFARFRAPGGRVPRPRD